ncbi:MAG TPA: neutral/alkaline non-lysosomal ceramidase N-terminal domain-containing protein [Candidatus Binataceae bacterium]|nr:neutral/alkaline non-lysosomal ceramidase N-terminal domain-containing protein [Candidatus Binataceae bacterium]
MSKLTVTRRSLPVPPPSDGFVAGVGKVDITPPPGVPLWGYSRAGSSVGAGFRTRLYARAIYLQDARGERIVIVQCDLGGMSALLHHTVARMIEQETGVADDRLMIAATHTHSGVGGFFGVPIYDDFGGEKVGFDPKALDFMAPRIAKAIKTAYSSRQPAKIATGQTQVFGLSRNRSIEGFVNNRTLTDQIETPVRMGPEYEGVDHTLTMIRIDRVAGGKTVPIGAFTNFAVHGTVVPSENDLYSADVMAGAERTLEWRIAADAVSSADDVVNLFTNANEGDVEAAYTTQGFPEAHRIGIALGNQMVQLYEHLAAKLTNQVTLSRNYEELKPSVASKSAEAQVCMGSIGFPVLGGAQGGRSGLYYFGRTFKFFPSYAGARRKVPQGCHGHKIPAFWGLQSIFFGSSKLPDDLPVQIFRINELLLIALPGEFTTEMGRRIKAAAKAAAKSFDASVGSAAIVGLASQYSSYYTTPEEYDIQNYEGGSTLYGRTSGPWMQSRVEALIKQMGDSSFEVEYPTEWTYTTGWVRNWYKSPTGEQITQVARSVKIDPAARTVAFSWYGLSAGDVMFDQSLVRLETLGAGGEWQALAVGGVPVDDRGLDIEVRIFPRGWLNSSPGAEWRATWYVNDPPSGSIRFAILPRRNTPPLYSAPFTFDGTALRQSTPAR